MSQYKIRIQQGATLRFAFEVADEAGVVDLTGYDARMKFREDKGSPDAVISLTVGSGLTIYDVSGLVEVHLTPVQTAALKVMNMVYDLELIAPNTDVYRVIEGVAIVSGEVTH